MRYVGAILLSGDTLLLGWRAAHRSYPDSWDIIGGHVEPGETIEQALVREIEEEIGVTPVDFAKLTSLQADEIELHIYCVDAWIGGSPVLRNDEHAELRWFTVEAACALPNLASDEYIASSESCPQLLDPHCAAGAVAVAVDDRDADLAAAVRIPLRPPAIGL